MWRLWQGELWRDFNALLGIILGLWTLWGIGVALIQQFRTHQWRTKKTLLYTLLGGILIIGGAAVAYPMYRDRLRNFVLQNLNAQHVRIAAHQQESVQPLWALLPLTGTVENPIQLCHSDTALLKVEAFLSDEVLITFPVTGGRYRRDTIHLRVGGEHVQVMDDGTRITEKEELGRDVREMAEPLDLQTFLVSGLNRLHFYVEPYMDPADAMALVVRLLRGDTEQVLRISYVYGNRSDGYPVTDIYFDLKPCNAR
jgi:hypothetical protein